MPEINGTNSGETLNGTIGDDTINALGGNDIVYGGDGVDVIHGGAGVDTLYGEGGNDEIWDEAGRRTNIYGGDGGDVIFVNLISTATTDHSIIDGGLGYDNFSVSIAGPGRATIIGGPGGGDGSDGGFALIGIIPTGGITISGVNSIGFTSDTRYSTGTITVTDFAPNAQFDIAEYAVRALNPYGYDDRYSPFELGFMSMEQRGADTVIVMHLEGVSSDFVIFQNVDMGDLTWQNLFGFNGGYRPSWYVGNEVGGNVAGTVAADTLNGTRGDDVITGLGGDDVIAGGGGNDTLSGGGGADLFVFDQRSILTVADPLDAYIHMGGFDTVTDFDVAEDRIDVSSFGLAYWADIQNAMRQSGSDVVIDLPLGGSVTLQNVALSGLSVANFANVTPGNPFIAPLPMTPPIGATRMLVSPGDGTHVVASGTSLFAEYTYTGGMFSSSTFTGVSNLTNNGTLYHHTGGASGFMRDPQVGVVINNGTMISVTDSNIGHGILSLSGLDSFTNNGTFQVQTWLGDAYGTEDYDSTADITNNGLFTVRASYNAWGIYRHNGGTVVNDTNGQILVEGASAVGIVLARGQHPADTSTAVVNNGLIEAVATGADLYTGEDFYSIGVLLYDSGPVHFAVENNGTIRAEVAVLSSNETTLTNGANGHIIGDVFIGDSYGSGFAYPGDDVITNAGIIDGYVYTRSGDDSVDTAAGRINGLVVLGDGDDSYVGGAFLDVVQGGRDDDTLDGAGGNDLLLAGQGNDTITGGLGNDGLYGEYGDDTITTFGGDNAFGGSGEDIFIASDYRFRLIDGGAGFDTLRLADGGTTFDLTAMGQSGRIARVEHFELTAGQTLTVRTNSAASVGSSDGFVYVSGAAGSTAQLVGNWTAGSTITVGGINFVTYSTGKDTAYVGSGLTVTIVASLAVGSSGLDAIQAGALPPLPGVIAGADLSFNSFGASYYNPVGAFTIADDEIWVAFDALTESIFGGFNNNGSPFINNGVIYNDSANAAYALQFQYLNDVTNNGLISVIPDRVDGGGATAVSGAGHFVNNGNVIVDVIQGLARGLFNDGSSSPIVNNGLMSVRSAQGDAQGVYLYNSGDPVNTGEILVEAGGIATGVEGRLGVFQLDNDGDIIANSLNGAFDSIGVHARDFFTGGGSIGNSRIDNSGLISADIAIRAFNQDPFIIDGFDVTNSGTIVGHIDFSGMSETGAGMSAAVNIVTNTGGITGNIYFGNGNDVYNGQNGTITGTVFAGYGADQFFGGVGAETVDGSFGNDTLNGGAGNDALFGGAGNDALNGGIGDDSLDGGVGIDTLVGGTGNDSYFVNIATDTVTELSNQGTDTVNSSVTWTLANHFENLTLTGGAAVNASGNSVANVITGNLGANTLAGLGGNDTLIGGAGNDKLIGGAGVDVLIGGSGNDTYQIVDSLDTVTELAGEGTDLVQSSVDFILGTNIEKLFLTGGALVGTGNDLANTIVGTGGANTLSGLAGNDYIYGGAGNDTITGGAGRDQLFGEAGADVFAFDDGDFGGVSSATADYIRDFSLADGDTINLSAVDAIAGGADNAFAFIGTAEFSGTAGELRFQSTATATIVMGDTNGDGVADFWIVINGAHALDQFDFGL